MSESEFLEGTSAKVQIALDVSAPHFVKRQLEELGMQMIERARAFAHPMALHRHVKPDGSQIGCNLNLTTDKGVYHSYAKGWNLRAALIDGFDHLETQLHRHSDRRSYA